MVSQQVRSAEAEIDANIRRLPIWKCSKTLLVKQLMDLWRDGLELAYMKAAHGATFQMRQSLEEAKVLEHKANTGVFWCLKWALEYGSDSAVAAPTIDQIVATVTEVGSPYQILVDALKLATAGGNEIDIDTNERTIIVYEGGNVTG